MPFRYGKKRQGPRRRGRVANKFAKLTFKSRVLRALRGEQETKIAKLSSLTNAISTSITTPLQLMPAIRQGTSSHGERIGSSITLRKLTIKGWIQIPPANQTTGDGVQLGR